MKNIFSVVVAWGVVGVFMMGMEGCSVRRPYSSENQFELASKQKEIAEETFQKLVQRDRDVGGVETAEIREWSERVMHAKIAMARCVHERIAAREEHMAFLEQQQSRLNNMKEVGGPDVELEYQRVCYDLLEMKRKLEWDKGCSESYSCCK